MEWYKILGVSKDADEKEIKIAYSKLLKIKGPDSDPEGYKELRSAFDRGMKVLKNKKSLVNYNDYEEESENLNYTGIVQYSEEDLNPIKNKIPKYSFKESLDNIYLILGERVNIDNWKELINSEFMWDSNGFKIGERLIINKISKNPYIPDEVIQLLSKYFNWIERELELYDSYEKSTIDKLLSLINKPSGINYKPLINFKDTRGNIYMEYRQKADENHQILALDNTLLYAEKAYEIYQEDEVVLGMLAIYYYHNDKLDKALDYTTKALSINEKYDNSYMMMGSILYKKGKYSEALIYFNKVNQYKYDITEYTSSFCQGNCYYKLENFIEAKRFLLKVQYRSKRAIKNDLRNTNRKLNGKKVFIENRGLKVNERLLKKFIKGKNKSLEHGKRTKLKIFGIMMAAVLVYLPISVIVKFFGVIFRYNPLEIKGFDKLISLEDKTKIKIMPNNMKITNYYLVKSENSSYEILKEQEVYDRGLWKEVDSLVLTGSYDGKIILFTGKNFTLEDFNIKNYRGTLIGRIDSLDNKLFDEILMDNDIKKQDSFYGKIIINSKRQKIAF